MLKWKSNWPTAQANIAKWWNRQGLVVSMPVRRPARENITPPPPPSDSVAKWTDLDYRIKAEEYALACTEFELDTVPYLITNMGPGGLGSFLGATPHFEPKTVWYEACIDNPDTFGPIRFDPANKWFQLQMAFIDAAVARSAGKYIVSLPDLIEGLDTLAAMRGTEAVLADLIDRPAWVHDRLGEINEAYFLAFEPMYQKVKDDEGGNAFANFRIWGPGRTSKLQCDISCMISQPMFREFVQPYLSAQCDLLDYTLYHLDGPGAVQHLDALLEIESLDAIQWMPGAGVPTGGDKGWYDLYRRILAGGKSVQATGVKPDEIIPLIDAVGPKGLFIWTGPTDPIKADELAGKIEQYR